MDTSITGTRRTPRARAVPAAAPAEAEEEQKRSWQELSEALQTDIVYGRLLPKEHLIEDDLMRRFGTSRYSVRRALEDLQALGLAVREENRGTRIRSYTPQEVLDLFEFREIIETAAALRMPMPVGKPVLDELARIHRRYDAAARVRDLYHSHVINDEFRRTLFSLCSNAVLRDEIAALARQLQPLRMRFFMDESRVRQVSINHTDVLNALKSGDSKLVAKVCGRIVSESKAQYARTVLETALP